MNSGRGYLNVRQPCHLGGSVLTLESFAVLYNADRFRHYAPSLDSSPLGGAFDILNLAHPYLQTPSRYSNLGPPFRRLRLTCLWNLSQPHYDFILRRK